MPATTVIAERSTQERTYTGANRRKARRRLYQVALLVVVMTLGGLVATADPASASHHGPGEAPITCAVLEQPTLAQGSTHECVASLQHFLRSLAFINGDSGLDPGLTDSHFGPRTERAVKRYQQIRSLSQDGIVGEDTWGKIIGDCLFFADIGNRNVCHVDVPY